MSGIVFSICWSLEGWNGRKLHRVFKDGTCTWDHLGGWHRNGQKCFGNWVHFLGGKLRKAWELIMKQFTFSLEASTFQSSKSFLHLTSSQQGIKLKWWSVKQKLYQHHQQPVSLWLHPRQNESSASIASQQSSISSQTLGSKRSKEWTRTSDATIEISDIPILWWNSWVYDTSNLHPIHPGKGKWPWEHPSLAQNRAGHSCSDVNMWPMTLVKILSGPGSCQPLGHMWRS